MEKIFAFVQQYSGRLTKICQGRSTMFFTGFFVVGTISHFLRRLDQTYILYMGTLLSYIVGHSVKDDYFAKKNSDGSDPSCNKQQ